MSLTIESLKKMPFASIDLHFANYVMELAGGKNPLIYAAAAIASASVRKGHTCCDLTLLAENGVKTFSDFFRLIFAKEEDEILLEEDPGFPELSAFRACFQPPAAIALEPGAEDGIVNTVPLVLDPHGRLYLSRYYLYEKDLAGMLLNFLRAEESDFHPDREQFNGIIKFFHLQEGVPVERTDWQKFAAFLAGFSRFTIITGGPGTGKTTVVAAVLALILEKYMAAGERLPRIMLCAPTGKAQHQLSESIRSGMSDLNCSEAVRKELERIIDPENPEHNCGTIHSLLGMNPDSPNGRKNEKSPLEADILLADEVSMISLPLMSKLIRAVKPDAKIILLGDKDQLSSVESGAVLSDLCKNARFNVLPQERKTEFCELTDSPEKEIPPLPSDPGSPLTGHIAELKISRRFDENSQIGRISSMIRERKSAEEIAGEIRRTTKDFVWEEIPFYTEDALKKFFESVQSDIMKRLKDSSLESMKEVYHLLYNHKILCAVRGGGNGVENINLLCRRIFGMTKEQSHGLPVLILENDKVKGLSNGDIGIFWKVGEEMKVFFPSSSPDSEPKCFCPFELPAWEPVFAMTIHKSQGASLNHVLISLPPKETPILTRELLYTAITRAKKSVKLWCPEHLIKPVLEREVIRHSGLADRLSSLL